MKIRDPNTGDEKQGVCLVCHCGNEVYIEADEIVNYGKVSPHDIVLERECDRCSSSLRLSAKHVKGTAFMVEFRVGKKEE